MRMRRYLGGILVSAILCASAVMPVAAEGALSGEARRLLAQARSAAWTDALAGELDRLSANVPLAPGACDFVIDGVGPGELLPDPLEAAAALHSAARQVDEARRRGIPLPLLRAEMRLAWESSRATGAAFSLRLQQRGQSAVAGFAAGSRRTWDPQYEGRGGSDTSAAGAGMGGRW
jgi:hypothetical protein